MGRGFTGQLVIFPIPGNNTFKTSNFADLRFLFEEARVRRSLPQYSYRKTFFIFQRIFSCTKEL